MGGASNFTRLTRRFSFLVVCAVVTAAAHVLPAGAAPEPKPSLNLDQCRNGQVATPNDCDATGWDNGNLNPQQAHYMEGQSAPYRLVMQDLPLATPITVDLGYDVMHGGKHAIDFLTHYDRIAEDVLPADGVTGLSTATVGTFPIPAPSSVGSPVPGQPTAAFSALPASERVMTLFGGLITGMTYVSEGDLASTGNSAAQVSVTFVADSPTAVLAWGGHIASPDDWGVGNSASGVSGSPYHMSVESWSLNNAGRQDRSMQASVIIAGPPPPVPAQLTVTKEVINDDGGTGLVADFDLFVDETQVTSGDVSSLPAGSYTVSEGAHAGYESVIGGDCAADGTITLVAGQVAECTITNDDIAPPPPAPAQLTVTKVVVNDDGGSAVVGDFDLFVDQTQVTSGAANSLAAGSYMVSEGLHFGYESTIDGDCAADGTITLAAGESAECTITNDDVAVPPVPAELTVTKIVINDDEGTGEVADFDLFVGGVQVISGDANLVDAGSYTVSEGAHAGYLSTIGGDCAADGTITLAAGESVECTITNDDVAGEDPPVDPPTTNPPTTNPGTDVESQTASETPAGNPTPPLQTVPLSTSPVVPAPVTGSTPANSGQELPRTGAGLREEALLGLLLMLAGLLARGAGRRNRPSEI